jgi:ABC-type sugar transport system permease subunit
MRQSTTTAWQFLVFPVVVYSAIIIVPFFHSLAYSVTDWDGISAQSNFVGLANYARVFTDPAFSLSLLHNIIWMAIFLLLPTGLGLLVACLVDRDMVGATVFKTIVYIPMVFSYVIVGLVWTFVYEPRLGVLNLFLRAVGLDHWTQAWLANPDTALLSIIFAASWQHTGLCMVLFLAGLRTVPTELIEAAHMDGCNTRQLYARVILPQLSHVTVVVVSLTVIHSLKSFDIVYIMTKGGPFRTSEVLTTFMFRESFWNYRMGYGSAISVVLFALVLSVVTLYLRSSSREQQS